MRFLPLLALLLIPQDKPQAIFQKYTQDGGLGGVASSRVAFCDLNSDGRPDALIERTRVFLHDGKKLVEVKYRRPERVSVVQVGDVNNDGHPDLFVGRSTDLSNRKFRDDGLRSEIHLGDGRGRFQLLKFSGVGRRAETTVAACFVDVNRDGNLDLFVGNAYTAYGKSYEAFPDRLYLGKGDGTFEDVTEKAGLLGEARPGRKESRRPTYGVTHTDWNNDGHPDLLVMTYGRQWNRLWRNNGDGTFTDVGEETTFDGDANRKGAYPSGIRRTAELPYRSNGNTFDAAVADFDNDGDMDCFLAEITHSWAGPSSDRSMLLVNQGKKAGFKFKRDPERIKRIPTQEKWNQGDLHAGWLDIDNDGRLDLLIASSDYPDDQLLRLFHQKEDGTFEDWTGRLGFRWRNASQISLGDFNRDGATDILVGTNLMRLTKTQRRGHNLNVGLYLNTLPARLENRHLSLRLMGKAVGARVTIRIGRAQQVREVYGGLGHAGHRDDDECRFGVGKAEAIDRMEVRWPDGTIQEFETVETNRFYTLKKGGSLK